MEHFIRNTLGNITSKLAEDVKKVIRKQVNDMTKLHEEHKEYLSAIEEKLNDFRKRRKNMVTKNSDI